MTLSQMFMKIKTKGTKKFSAYDNFEAFRKFVYQATKERVNTKKGQKKKTSRLSIDIGCTFNKFKNQQWELHEFINKWENLEIENS